MNERRFGYYGGYVSTVNGIATGTPRGGYRSHFGEPPPPDDTGQWEYDHLAGQWLPYRKATPRLDELRQHKATAQVTRRTPRLDSLPPLPVRLTGRW